MLWYLLLIGTAASVYHIFMKRRLYLLIKLLMALKYMDRDTCKLSADGSMFIISYRYLNKDYNLYLPYDNNIVASTIGKNVLLLRDGKLINVTQQMGLPYFASAAQLGANYFIIEDIIEGTSNKLEPNVIPFTEKY